MRLSRTRTSTLLSNPTQNINKILEITSTLLCLQLVSLYLSTHRHIRHTISTQVLRHSIRRRTNLCPHIGIRVIWVSSQISIQRTITAIANTLRRTITLINASQRTSISIGNTFVGNSTLGCNHAQQIIKTLIVLTLTTIIIIRIITGNSRVTRATKLQCLKSSSLSCSILCFVIIKFISSKCVRRFNTSSRTTQTQSHRLLPHCVWVAINTFIKRRVAFQNFCHTVRRSRTNFTFGNYASWQHAPISTMRRIARHNARQYVINSCNTQLSFCH